MKTNLRIAIIGAGLGGLPAAKLLQARGIDVTVYEQAPSFTRLGAGINLGPNVMKVMREIGVEQKLLEIGIQPKAWTSRQWDTGKTQFELPLRGDAAKQYGAPYLLIHRGDFHSVLTNAVEPGSIKFGKKLVGLDETSGGITMRFQDGTESQADLVIGADGINSTVREIIQGPEEPRYTGFVAHRAIFPADILSKPIPHDLTKWWADDGAASHDDRHCLVYYLTRKRDEIYIVSGVPDPNWDSGTSYVDADLNEMIGAFEGFHDDLLQVLRACPAATKWPILDRKPLPLWSSGKIVLLGDACHPMKPHMGQGAAMAAEDAVILVRCLEHHRWEDIISALKMYENCRKARTSDVQNHSYLNQWLRHDTDPTWVFAYDPIAVELGVSAGVAPA